MTIYCKRCGDIPLIYKTIRRKNYCNKCAEELFIIELKKLENEFSIKLKEGYI